MVHTNSHYLAELRQQELIREAQRRAWTKHMRRTNRSRTAGALRVLRLNRG